MDERSQWTQVGGAADGRGGPARFGRRDFLLGVPGGALLALLASRAAAAAATGAAAPDPQPQSDLFWVREVPDQPFPPAGGNRHSGVDTLLELMGAGGLRFYRSAAETATSGPWGMIAAGDVVLVKVNAQWKYRGCTNSDVVRGLVQAILDHPDGFTGEVVIVENGQGRGSLRCDTSSAYDGDTSVQANANDRTHSFRYLVSRIFDDPRVSSFLLDPIRGTFIGRNNHATNGYRRFLNVSYPCFTTAGGRRVELRQGIWQGSGYASNLKLINVPVLKHHDEGGSELTASLKHFYGLVSMEDGQSGFRHYAGLGNTCGTMISRVRAPVLSIVDAIWVSHSSLKGYPADTTLRVNQLVASQDPVALDYWAAKHILHPIDNNPRHHPAFEGVRAWLRDARTVINARGGLYDPEAGIFVGPVTKTESAMRVLTASAAGARA